MPVGIPDLEGPAVFPEASEEDILRKDQAGFPGGNLSGIPYALDGYAAFALPEAVLFVERPGEYGFAAPDGLRLCQMVHLQPPDPGAGDGRDEGRKHEDFLYGRCHISQR